MLLGMASVEGEALSEASPCMGSPNRNDRGREMCRASGIYIRGPHPQD